MVSSISFGTFLVRRVSRCHRGSCRRSWIHANRAPTPAAACLDRKDPFPRTRGIAVPKFDRLDRRIRGAAWPSDPTLHRWNRKDERERLEGTIVVRHDRDDALFAFVHDDHEACVADALVGVFANVEAWKRQSFYTNENTDILIRLALASELNVRSLVREASRRQSRRPAQANQLAIISHRHDIGRLRGPYSARPLPHSGTNGPPLSSSCIPCPRRLGASSHSSGHSRRRPLVGPHGPPRGPSTRQGRPR